MSQHLILCRSLTTAQRAQRLLERSGIVSSVVKAPPELTGSGCGYSLSLFRHFEEADAILQRSNIATGKRFVLMEDGRFRELNHDLPR
jgi:hypothetical protein